VLDREIRNDDAKRIIEAIEMVRGVLSVEPHVADYVSRAADKTRDDSAVVRLRRVIDAQKQQPKCGDLITRTFHAPSGLPGGMFIGEDEYCKNRTPDELEQIYAMRERFRKGAP
jgi:hypothetical protein